jgi:hypothetical protein
VDRPPFAQGAAPALAAAAAVAIPSNGVRAASEPRAHSSAPASAPPAPSPYSAPVAPAPMPLHQPMPQAYSHAPHVPPPVPAPFFPAPAAQFLAPAALQYPPTAQYQPAPMDMYNNVPVPAAAPAFVPRTAPPPPPRQQQVLSTPTQPLGHGFDSPPPLALRFAAWPAARCHIQRKIRRWL